MVPAIEEVDGKSWAWVEDDGNNRRHILESDGWGCEQFIHFGSRLQSVEACPADAHQEQISCRWHEVCECPNLLHLKQRRGFGHSKDLSTPSILMQCRLRWKVNSPSLTNLFLELLSSPLQIVKKSPLNRGRSEKDFSIPSS
ncbi:hypothetical protein TNCV_133271 [Trichonephila clavipes]|nr:hypothetical protein TNCV_133271 [Trichonephila clavipes]